MADVLKVKEIEADRIVVGRGTPAEIVIESGLEGARFALRDRNGVERISIDRTGGSPACYQIILWNGDAEKLIDLAVTEEGAFIEVGEEKLASVACPQATPREDDPAADLAARSTDLAH